MKLHCIKWKNRDIVYWTQINQCGIIKMLWIKNGRWKTMKEYDSLSDNEKRNMLASVANLYYNAEMTQNQIAERFFTSRS